MLASAALLAGTALASPSLAQDADPVRAELARARAEIAAQRRQLEAQEQRLQALERRLSTQAAAPVGPPIAAPQASATVAPVAPNPATGSGTPPAPAIAAAQGSAAATPGDPASIQQAPLERVGQAPADLERPPELAVLPGSEGSVVTRRGQLTGELQFDYARADRNRALFRGIEIVESVLVGVFNINESRQDVLTASASLRYGVTDRFEVGVRVPFVHRSDSSILAPIQGSTNNDAAATVDSSARGTGIGDFELSARYQLLAARGGLPYLIGNLQVVVPSGTDPFGVPRLITGEATKAATGSGFWGISPSLTAILPSDPAVLFGTIGYTHNFGRNVDTQIPPVIIEYVKPGDALSFSGGIGISLNQRASINLGYAHSWAFGTRTRTRLREPTPAWPGTMSTTARDLQLGRLLFGMTYRVSDRASVNWSVEMGATDDATDLRSVLRIPLILFTGS